MSCFGRMLRGSSDPGVDLASVALTRPGLLLSRYTCLYFEIVAFVSFLLLSVYTEMSFSFCRVHPLISSVPGLLFLTLHLVLAVRRIGLLTSRTGSPGSLVRSKENFVIDI
jgi:hypothetical protein